MFTINEAFVTIFKLSLKIKPIDCRLLDYVLYCNVFMGLKKHLACTLFFLITLSCQDEASLPKPKAFLALEYPKPEYVKTALDCPFEFKRNMYSKVRENSQKRPCWLDIHYPKMKGSIYMSYYPVDNNLETLIIDAQRLPLKHEIKADAILSQTFINQEHHTFGLFYEVKGNAASQALFYVTDSLNHFMTGSIYFKAKPNYDSILPAAEYLKNDMRKIIESLRWKD